MLIFIVLSKKKHYFCNRFVINASLAQLVEQLIRNE